MKRKLLCSVLVLLGCAPETAKVDLAAERARLLEMHAQILESHRSDDLEAWMALEDDTVTVGSRGDLIFTTRDQRTEMRRGYLNNTNFTVYRDLSQPLVEISSDGTLGWVYANIEVDGTYSTPQDTLAISDVWVWIELYKKFSDGWRMVGNVSAERG